MVSKLEFLTFHIHTPACKIMKRMSLYKEGKSGGGGGEGVGYSHILAMRVCAAGKGMVFKPFGLV